MEFKILFFQKLIPKSSCNAFNHRENGGFHFCNGGFAFQNMKQLFPIFFLTYLRIWQFANEIRLMYNWAQGKDRATQHMDAGRLWWAKSSRLQPTPFALDKYICSNTFLYEYGSNCGKLPAWYFPHPLLCCHSHILDQFPRLLAINSGKVEKFGIIFAGRSSRRFFLKSGSSCKVLEGPIFGRYLPALLF